jgi:tetratricopeptide (TPR) repeat protein
MMDSQTKLSEAIAARISGQLDRAITILAELLKSAPLDPLVNLQMAWACDSMGKESEAGPYYEVALANGLAGEDRRGAMLGLGSTYRCLGEYQKSLAVFDTAVTEFPEDRSFKVFRALTLYNLGKAQDAVGTLLLELLETTNDPYIKTYEKALRFYADKLDETWR